ncbi:YifB family Mg chelatase-like AAA ATPase [Microbacterium karelineae]|uniref:YifB family Mg chelatase-like AAA ATPase n=1 Tax=Microbacterium karelineae TaxID=2654283 RepID=UPI0012EAF4E5|nr:ATP-binding protein [Microbacterium karelineae]
MIVVRTWAVALTGLHGALIEVEADITQHKPDFRLIGMPDKALGEAVRRVTNACENSGLALPDRRLTVNLSPASLPKQGSGFDLSVALAALATDGRLDPESLARTVHVGELGLDGRVRAVPGVLPAVLAAVEAGRTRVVVPEENLAEAELVTGAEVTAVRSLAQAARLHGAEVDDAVLEGPDPSPTAAARAVTTSAPPPDLAEVVGQPEAVEALLVAAAGGHHLLMSGPPGAGKTMLARRLPGILPPLDDAAALEVASVRSLTGEAITSLSRTPPFEAPHHSATLAALVGGGSRRASPGAIARASRGVLFIDEVAEAPRSLLDALRQPLEHGAISIHRSGFTASFPARFQLVLAMNPCPCGQFPYSWSVAQVGNTLNRSRHASFLRPVDGPMSTRWMSCFRTWFCPSGVRSRNPSTSAGTSSSRSRFGVGAARTCRARSPASSLFSCAAVASYASWLILSSTSRTVRLASRDFALVIIRSSAARSSIDRTRFSASTLAASRRLSVRSGSLVTQSVKYRSTRWSFTDIGRAHFARPRCAVPHL